MRWKFSRNTDPMYTCLWCFHVKTGTFLLGVLSLLLQVATLVLILVAFLRPDVVPTWVSSLIVPNANGKSIHIHDKMMSYQGGMVKNDNDQNIIMGDSSMHGRADMKNMMGENHEMNRRDLNEVIGAKDVKKTVSDTGMMDDQVMKKIMEDDGVIREHGMHHRMKSGGMMDSHGMEKVVVESGKIDIQAVKKLVEDNGIIDYENDKNGMVNAILDTAQMHADMNERFSDQLMLSSDATSQRTTQKSVELDSDDKFLMFVMLVGCIVASVMLIRGVIKGQPGFLMPYMGLQVFDFCISSLIVFTCFSYAPNIKHWIAAQPDSLPLKSCLMSIETDRLMLGLILISVLVLVVKAYLMAVVWACYKYLTQYQHDAVRGRRRSTDDDVSNPEDSELLLPPKYEDIVGVRELRQEAGPAPPPYAAA